MSLLFTAWMSTHIVREGVVDAHIDSKETFWLAAELSSAPYAFFPFSASIIGKAGEHLDAPTHQFSKNLCSTQTLHIDSEQKPLWISGSLRRKNTSPSLDFASFTHWMIGTQAMEWQNQGDEFWCAKGQMVKIEGTELAYKLEKSKELAQRVDAVLGKEIG